jgi:type I restriction enzyme M protein
MASAIYVGLDEKIARRIGIMKINLADEKEKEIENIVIQFKQYESGITGPYVVPAFRLTDRLDVKFCRGDRGRKKATWQTKGYDVTPLAKELTLAKNRDTKVIPTDVYQFLQVNYDGEVVDGEVIEGEQCSYSTLFAVKTWDILLSNMGVGRGAVAIVPPYHSEKFVSNEYSILNAVTKEEAVYYCNLLRTKEILGDILSTTTGMNRGRIKWDNIKNVEVPKYVKGHAEIEQLVRDLEDLWEAYKKFYKSKEAHINRVVDELEVNGEDAHQRWLAYKPPE